MSSQRYPAIKADQPLQGEAVGRIFFKKDFHGKLFTGVIDAYHHVGGHGMMYHVVFEDGDREDDSWTDLMEWSPKWLAEDALHIIATRPKNLPKTAITDAHKAYIDAVAQAARKAKPAPMGKQARPAADAAATAAVPARKPKPAPLGKRASPAPDAAAAATPAPAAAAGSAGDAAQTKRQKRAAAATPAAASAGSGAAATAAAGAAASRAPSPIEGAAAAAAAAGKRATKQHTPADKGPSSAAAAGPSKSSKAAAAADAQVVPKAPKPPKAPAAAAGSKKQQKAQQQQAADAAASDTDTGAGCDQAAAGKRAAKAQQAGSSKGKDSDKDASKASIKPAGKAASTKAGSDKPADKPPKPAKAAAADADTTKAGTSKAAAAKADADKPAKPAKPAAVNADAAKAGSSKAAAKAGSSKAAAATEAGSKAGSKAAAKAAAKAASGAKPTANAAKPDGKPAKKAPAVKRTPGVKKPPVLAPLPEYGPARVCEQAWRQGLASHVSDLSRVRQLALGAMAPVMLKNGKAPIFTAKPEDLPVAHSDAAAHKLLKQHQVRHVPGKEPYHRHILPPHVMELLLAKDVPADEAYAAVLEAMKPTEGLETLKITIKPEPEADAEGESGEGEQEGEQQQKAKKGKAAAAAAAAAAGGGGDGAGEQQQKGKKGKAAAAAAAGEQQQKGKELSGKKRKAAEIDGAAAAAGGQEGRPAKKGPAGAAAAGGAKQSKVAKSSAAAATGGSGKVKGTKKASAKAAAVGGNDAAAAAGSDDTVVEVMEEWVIRQYQPLWVAMEDFADQGGELALAMKQARNDFNVKYRAAVVSEEVRYEKAKKAKAAGQEGAKAPSRRPDRVAESQTIQKGQAMNQRSAWGNVPGIKVNHRFDLRSEALIMGAHKLPVAGMASATLPHDIVIDGVRYKDLRAVTSVVASGQYKADQDSEGASEDDIVVYTGQGGCDLLGGKEQTSDQKLVSANSDMLVNVALGLPVRYFRRNNDADSSTGSSIFYDGLYYVVSCCQQYVLGKDKQGKQKKFLTFVYGLKRLPNQAPPASVPISHWKSQTAAKKKHTIERRAGACCRDISKGLEAGARVVATNEIDNVLPPGLDPVADKALLLDAANGRQWEKDPRPFTYIAKNVYTESAPEPQPPKLVIEGTPEGEAAKQELLAAAEAGCSNGGGQFMLPKWGGPLWNEQYVLQTAKEAADATDGPHETLKRLNGGNLPWTVLEGKGIAVSKGEQRVLVECGDWLGCQEGEACKQRQSCRPLRYPLEVYKTPQCGWGVWSWAPITSGSLVCVMYGTIQGSKVVEPGGVHGDSEYLFDMLPRPDLDHMHRHLPDRAEPAAAARGEEEEEEEHFVLCARDKGNVARYINHSCEPNLYVQPILMGHTDTRHVAIGLVAMHDIPPFTPLSYDYGGQYVTKSFGDGGCKCGAETCWGKLQAKREAEAAAAAAAGPSQL